MTLDGSFACKSALERFLARFPELHGNLTLLSLVDGDGVSEDEVVESIAELLLHPDYTIPLVGCFRPLGRRLVDKAVALLRIVLGKNSVLDAEGSIAAEVGEGEIHVIQFYHRAGRFLRLHEIACLAFCRVLDLAPYLLRTVLRYFDFAPPPFQRVLKVSSSVPLLSDDVGYILDVARVSLRLLQLEPDAFSEMWDWSCFVELVQIGQDVGCHAELGDSRNDILWCGIRILSIVLKMGEQFVELCGLDQEMALLCYKRWEEYCQDVVVEKAGFYLEPSALGTSGISATETYLQCSEDISLSVSSSHIHESQSVIRACKKVTNDRSIRRIPFVLTETIRRSFEMIKLAVNQKWPVLLHGPTGTGKTALVNQLAETCGNQVLFLHMDEQMDSKSLIGSYICAEQAGEFRWQPGSLTQALLNGFWIVFEDIDKAPSEVHSILLPLLEGSNSYMTGHGEVIKVSEDFRLFATVSNKERDWCRNAEGKIVLGSLWRKVKVGSPTDSDILDIIRTWYPCLELLSVKIRDTFRHINYFTSCELGGYHVNRSDSDGALLRFTLRDLLKWCSRIAGLGISNSGTCLSAVDCRKIHREAVDIFVASSASYRNRLLLMKEIATMWCIPASEVENLYPSNKPTVHSLSFEVQVGRAILKCNQGLEHLCPKKKVFVELCSSLHVLERIACSVKYNEPVLLVGETGTGKTTLVQNLAARLGQPMTVLNLSQQSDVADLLGGFKPNDARFVCIPLYEEFKTLFSKTYSKKANKAILIEVAKYVNGRKWKELLIQFQGVVRQHRKKLSERGEFGSGTKRKKPMGEDILQCWESFSLRIDAVLKQMQMSMMPFSFVEGAFITALKNGYWILLDELNLAPPETLQRILGVLEGESGTLCLVERGDVDYIKRHPDFRIFACMNPATDAGKKDLPYSVRSRFTEYFVDDLLSDEDMFLFVGQYMDDIQNNREIVGRIVKFYKEVKMKSQDILQDGANQKPHFSLRSLARALDFTKKARNVFGFPRALYDGFCMFFLNLLDGPSYKLMNNLILAHLLGGKMPSDVPFDHYVKVDKLHKHHSFVENYKLTRSITLHLTNLARAVFVRSPVLLQGPTSSGKTSLVRYLAAITGHEFVRINNHEHTDLQEYFGTYITDSQGKLKFHEGPLVKAVRNGHWIVLDELNLAPSDVLEALNRLLDDNRELFIPDLLETVPAHPNFMLFATQNPPTLYGGRKILSRAFRNRFVEIYVDEIPDDELQKILKRRCKVPRSYAVKMVEVMKELQLHRQSSKAFAGKHGFMTPRDLFRWADRFRSLGCSYEDLAKDGYYLLAERLRDESEKNVVLEILGKHLRVKIDTNTLYTQKVAGCDAPKDVCDHTEIKENLGKIFWTTSMQRLFFLVERCYRLREPVLLVGETGGGKTSVCQLLSSALGSKLHILNCHQYTETSDFIGGFHPVRDRSHLAVDFKYLVDQLKLSKVFYHLPADSTLQNVSSDIAKAFSSLSWLHTVINGLRQSMASEQGALKEELNHVEQIVQNLMQLYQKWETIFVWQDGPLVQAMKHGDLFLVDEISLADDSVLERLNSVLEPERVLTLAEKGGSDLEQVTAHQDFFLLATMNPGGDYGKKELSPALRNRFTEIWVPPISDLEELRSIALKRLDKLELSCIVDLILKFWEWFNHVETGRVLTVRDLLAWIAFINATESSLGLVTSFLHGAFLVLLDGLTLGTGISSCEAMKLREKCLAFLLDQVMEQVCNYLDPEISKLENYGWGSANTCIYQIKSDHHFGVGPFYILKGSMPCEQAGFEFRAPTIYRNALRVLRALQLPKPVLLEGSPGVGKTSLVVALAEFSGHTVVRINLSEQTDIMDLLGSDLPVESDEGIKFAWSDGILLQALKNGKWVLLDELNLAPQSVLEGLNAILDHRAEVYIPELGRSFKCPPSFRVFACQNPSFQGSGRKGLPKSFLNRFTKVYVDEMVEDDYLCICTSLFPTISKLLISKLISFNIKLHEDTMVLHNYGNDGSPWEFNLRDVIRSCQMIVGAPEKSKEDCFLNTVYIQRMRTMADRREVLSLYEKVFEVKPFINMYPRVQVTPKKLIVGSASYERNYHQRTKHFNDHLKILPSMGQSLEAVLHCVRYQWLCILVGTSSSGKTSLVRLLAQLTGNALHELNLSSGTDISELIGCFEQFNAFRHLRAVVCQVEGYVKECCSLMLKSFESLAKECRSFLSKWFTFLAGMKSTSASELTFGEHYESLSPGLLELLFDVIEQLRHYIEKYKLPVSWSSSDLERSWETIMKLRQKENNQQLSIKFEWVKGPLIKAIESGDWILLENANRCSPTVLDRINSLVEPSGSITVNECGLVNGKPLVLYAHPKFRLFLTVNQVYGEVSRAMRNRGVEVYLMPPHWLLHDCKEAEVKELRRYLILSGIPISNLVNVMIHAHLYARDAGGQIGVHITLLELTHWVQLFQKLMEVGNRPLWALNLSWEHIYLSSLGESDGKGIVNHGKKTFLSDSKFLEPGSLLRHSLSLPGGWPAPLKLRNFIWYSRETSVKQNFQYLEFLGAQVAAYYASCRPYEPVSCHKTHKLMPGAIPVHMLHHALYSMLHPQSVNHGIFDFDLMTKMLCFAANWTIEQATENDLLLYIAYFKWCSSKFEPFCSFFMSYLSIFEQDIWKHFINCWRDLSPIIESSGEVLIPLLSVNRTVMDSLDDHSHAARRQLYNVIQSVEFLQFSFIQWYTEDSFPFSDRGEFLSMYPILKSLRRLEKEILYVSVKSPSFEFPSHLYSGLIEQHMVLWNIISSSQSQWLPMCWRALKKAAVKLHDICPSTVHSLTNLMEEVQHLKKPNSWNLDIPKSLLWAHGGHPSVPSTPVTYFKLQQLLKLCHSVWPIRLGPSKQKDPETCDLLGSVLSTNVDIKYLAVQGVCMASYISEDHQDITAFVHGIEEIHMMLEQRIISEKHRLEGFIEAPQKSHLENLSSICCAFCLEAISNRPSLESWLETLPLLDCKSITLDMDFLLDLSGSILARSKEELYSDLSVVSERLRYALEFSLKFSSRPPTDFIPHQKLLWILEQWESVNSETVIGSLLCEMWFKWHSSLWALGEKQQINHVEVENNKSGMPIALFQPTKTAIIDHICQPAHSIKDYHIYCVKVRAASRYIWEDSQSGRRLVVDFLSAARHMFWQVIFAHKKAFDDEKFQKIQSILSFAGDDCFSQGMLEMLQSLIESSSHSKLNSLAGLYIEPLLRLLYLACPSHDLVKNVGNAWLYLGGLRFHLLQHSCDPTLKYTMKYTQLTDKISRLESEFEVRQESDYLAGRNSLRDGCGQRMLLQESLQLEKKKLQKRLVFRPDPTKFDVIVQLCDDFTKLVEASFACAKILGEGVIVDQMTLNKACNWQETSTSFIHQLWEECASYCDIIQPIQVAIFEMKLGLALLVSSALQKRFQNQIREDDVDRVLDTLHSFVQFPRCLAVAPIFVRIEAMCPDHLSSDCLAHVLTFDMSLLNKLVSLTQPDCLDKVISHHQLQATTHQIILNFVLDHVYSSSIMGKPSFLLLEKIFDEFTSIWTSVKLQSKEKEGKDFQQYKFRPRAFKMEDITEVDVSELKKFAADDSLSKDWQEILVTTEPRASSPTNEYDNLIEECNFIEGTISTGIVCVHSQLFGSYNLVGKPGILQNIDKDKLESFVESYDVYRRVIKGIPPLLSSSLDDRLLLEHLLSLCMAENKELREFQSDYAYNFYKDSNAPSLAKMVKPLITLQHQLGHLLVEYLEHPELQKVLNLTETLLALPFNTPIPKALLGLQFLLSKVLSLQDAGLKLSLSVHLQPILQLISSWRKLEIDSWQQLMDGVLVQYEVNAGKLWFPLYSVLQRKVSSDVESDNLSTIESLEEFMQTSSIGEFKKRLELVLSFHGQFNASTELEVISSPHLQDNLKILYNVFGYYIQFLPQISAHIEDHRRTIEKELKDLSKLSRWEDPHSSSKNSRQKLWKLMQKFNDVLQQPVMVFLNQEAMQRRIVDAPRLLEPESGDNGQNKKLELESPQIIFDLSQFGDIERIRSLWFDNWKKELGAAARKLSCGNMLSREMESILRQCLSCDSACNMYMGQWVQGWKSLEDVCQILCRSAHIWKHSTKSLDKRRALANLLSVLEGCGLSRHMSRISEVDLGPNQLIRCFLKPAYDVYHLLPNGSSSSEVKYKLSGLSDNFTRKVDLDWKVANECYFKSISMLQQVRQICLKFHKDLTLEQVYRSMSFLEHLVMIQQDQRSLAYGFSKNLMEIRKLIFPMKEFSTGDQTCSIISNQRGAYECMWQQKQLFDGLYSLTKDMSLLLTMVGKSHLDTCRGVRADINDVLSMMEMLIPEIGKSKDSLDLLLLGCCGTITTPKACKPAFIVSQRVEHMLIDNFQLIDKIGKDLERLGQQTVPIKSVKEKIISRFTCYFEQAKLMEEMFQSEHNTAVGSVTTIGVFTERYEETVKQIMSAFEKIIEFGENYSPSEHTLTRTLLDDFQSFVGSLQMNVIYDSLRKTIDSAVEFINCGGFEQLELCGQIEMYMKHLYWFVDILLNFGDGLLIELVAMHKTVAEMTHILANVLASLYMKGFGSMELDQEDASEAGRTQEASGTGMGEGEGMKDVSNQIEDEEQLLGTSEKATENIDSSNEIQNKKDKGIEMEEDFAGDTYSVSEDSEDEEEEEEQGDSNLESVMGEGSDHKDIVNEKSWDKEEDEVPVKPEKCEAGPSVKETDSTSQELRAKDVNASDLDESGVPNNNKPDEFGEEGENTDAGDEGCSDDEDTKEMKMEKTEAFESSSGLDVNEPNQDLKDDMSVDEPEEVDMEEPELDSNEIAKDLFDNAMADHIDETDSAQVDEKMAETGSGQVDENVDIDDPSQDQAGKDEDLLVGDTEIRELGNVDTSDGHMQNSDSVMPVNYARPSEPSTVPHIKWSKSSDLQNGVAPSEASHSNDVTEMEITMSSLSKTGDVADDQPDIHSPSTNNTTTQRGHANPYRSLGDALEEWKKRIKISSDPMDKGSMGSEELQDVKAEEYRYVTELENASSQALGPAMPEEVNVNVDGGKDNEDDVVAEQRENIEDMVAETENDYDICSSKHNVSRTEHKTDDRLAVSAGPSNHVPIGEEEARNGDSLGDHSFDLVSVGKYDFLEEEKLQYLSLEDKVFGKSKHFSLTTDDNAVTKWRRYELDTSRLSQELAEQLRLIMEPTQASKLQGDYKSGKRINMKKVIPYIASHFRKDKIWLRRTRPNKRDYQVVVAIDDSHSMTESGCGEVATKAMVTVCRAMSQLEVGQLAVASFGESGNIRLLHDFHQPFTSEAGVRMICGLDFKQDNKIGDDPVVDLLKFLNEKLDAAVTTARLPSGQNPLEQLVLIIGDGRFNEQPEVLKPYVRDMFNRKRMVAYIILDSQQESIMDYGKVSLINKKTTFTKYLDSFPFPYYIVLKNIEALPGTLADLLRQWFELMQRATD